MNKRIKKKRKQMENKKLIERYPFLLVRNRWTDKPAFKNPYYWIELDAMPNGWRRAFGLQMCEELREELLRYNFLYKYRIIDIKEKYGGLRWYDAGWPTGSKIPQIIDKYEELSYHICMLCGKPAETTSDGYWLETVCNDCKNKINQR